MRPQVLTLTLNPALDHTLELGDLRQGEVNRALAMQVDVGGKGFNIASCLADFGIPTAVTGLIGKDNAAPFLANFRAKGLEDQCLYLDGSTRINTKVVDRSRRQTTDINLPGPLLPPETIQGLMETLMARMDGLASSVRWVVLAGSLPPGWPENTYQRLTRHAHARGAQVALDTSGPALASSLSSTPDIVKPNRAELSEWAGRPLEDLPSVLAAARALLMGPRGPRTVVVSLGGEGALFLNRQEALLAHPAKAEWISTVGAGDAMVAGLVAAQIAGLPLAGCARLAIAFSSAKLARLGPHLPPPGQVLALAETVQLVSIG